MQYEWEQPRAFPASPFAAASGTVASDGEPARKREVSGNSSRESGHELRLYRAPTGTHYDAMDVDTPPRASFPASATATSNPFHFAEPSVTHGVAKPAIGILDFDANAFDAKEAFGLDETASTQDATHADADVSTIMVEEEHEEAVSRTSGALTVLNGGEARRRRTGATGSKKDKSPTKRRSSRTYDTDDDDDDEETVQSAAVGAKGRKPPASDFSFQVHHHHAPDTTGEVAPERWLNSNTPHTLLGYASPAVSPCPYRLTHLVPADTCSLAPSRFWR